MADTKATAEVRALANFYAVLQSEPSRAFYGLKHVLAANEAQAIDTLLISDNLFRYLPSRRNLASVNSLEYFRLRSLSVEERKRYVSLVESVRDNGGTVRIFSSLHVSGERTFRLGVIYFLLSKLTLVRLSLQNLLS